MVGRVTSASPDARRRVIVALYFIGMTTAGSHIDQRATPEDSAAYEDDDYMEQIIFPIFTTHIFIIAEA